MKKQKRQGETAGEGIEAASQGMAEEIVEEKPEEKTKKIGKKQKHKKEKKVLEPQYYHSATNMQTLNYKVYYMNKLEKALYFALACAVGAGVGYLFYGGIGKDAYGNPTVLTYCMNVLVMAGMGILAGVKFLPIRTKQILGKRRRELNEQFRSMLEGLTTSLGAGNNVMDSFLNVREDLQMQYQEDAYILQELEVIIKGIENNIAIEELLYDFGVRSGNDDILNFSEVFRVSYRKGGNIRDIIQNTHSILSQKMEIREDIETMVASNKMEQNIMIVMPVILVALIKGMSSEFAGNFVTAAGIASTTIGVACFAGAYVLGQKILDINI